MICDTEDKLKKLGFNPEPNSLKAIAKGGSMRSFLRFESSQRPYIFCEYSAEKEENFLYANIANFLKQNGVNVCGIALHDPNARILIMEDLGELDLLDFSKKADDFSKEKAYKNALKEAFKIHTKASASFKVRPIKLMPGFDEKLYEWEHDYFYKNLICELLGLKEQAPKEEWRNMIAKFLSLPQCLLHRDFQSQNIIVNPETLETSLIDFQGMRIGVNWYDLGSLIFDPYSNLEPKLREKLFKFYCELSNLNPDLERNNFLELSSQRLMQALGAFAFLYKNRGKSEYIKYVVPALKNLLFCAQSCGLKYTAKLAGKALEKAKSIA